MVQPETATKITGIHEVMDILKDMPLPKTLSKWDQVVSIQAEGQDHVSFEWLIQFGKWRISEGGSGYPGCIISGTENEILNILFGLTRIETKNIKSGTRKWSIKDASNFGMLIGQVSIYLKETGFEYTPQSEPVPFDENKEHDFNAIWDVIFKSIDKVGHWARKDSSVLKEISGQILKEYSTWSSNQLGLTSNDTARHVRKQISENAIELSKGYFDKLSSKGGLVTPDVFHINYRSSPERGDFLNMGLLVAFYAGHIAAMKAEDLNTEIMDLAYRFFLHDLLRYFKEQFKFAPLADEEIQDWCLIPEAVGGRFLFITNHRIALTTQTDPGSIIHSIKLQDGESQPSRVYHVDKVILFQTNLRIMWLWPTQSTFSTGYKLYYDPVKLAEFIKHAFHSERSKLLLASNENYILYWFEGAHLTKIPLKAFTHHEVKITEFEKKTLFITQKIKQTQVVLHADKEVFLDIDEKDLAAVQEFFAQVKEE